MTEQIKQAFTKIIEKKSEQYFEEMFRHNNRSLIVLAVILTIEQLLYGIVFTEVRSHIGRTHLFTAGVSLLFLFLFVQFYYRNRDKFQYSKIVNALHLSYLAILILIAIYRAIYVGSGDYSIPVIYIALLYGSAFLFYFPPFWSLALYGATLFVFVLLGRNEVIGLVSPTFVQDITANSFLAWCASMMAYYRFLQQVDSIILIEEKNVELKVLSEVDSLTQLWNRRKIDVCLEEIHKRADETKSDYAVILIDIDHFKSINDRFGHPVGDEVLKQFAAILNAHTGPDEMLGRWGGEEFMILCKLDARRRAGELSETIRQAVECHDFNIPKTITCSLGVGFYKAGLQSHEVVHSADTALYLSKSRGRNKVTLGAE